MEKIALKFVYYRLASQQVAQVTDKGTHQRDKGLLSAKDLVMVTKLLEKGGPEKITYLQHNDYMVVKQVNKRHQCTK